MPRDVACGELAIAPLYRFQIVIEHFAAVHPQGRVALQVPEARTKGSSSQVKRPFRKASLGSSHSKSFCVVLRAREFVSVGSAKVNWRGSVWKTSSLRAREIRGQSGTHTTKNSRTATENGWIETTGNAPLVVSQ